MAIRVGGSNLAFSAAWLGGDGGRAGALVRAARDLGLTGIKLGPHVTADPLDRLARAFKTERIRTVALQNVFIASGGPERYLHGDTLTDSTAAEAEASFKLTLETARAARTLGTQRIILHPGFLREDRLATLQDDIVQLFDKNGITEELIALVRQGRELRAELQETWLDRVARMLHRLLKSEPEITFCIENRSGLDAPPDPAGLGYLFEDLRSPRLKYWHNTGHARIQEALGLVGEGAWLGEHGARAAGVHLQDASGISAGRPPGSGDVDFKEVLRALPSDADRVIDLPRAASPEEMQLAVKELKSLGY